MYLGTNLMSSSVNWGPYVFTATGSYTIKLVTFGCSGTVYNKSCDRLQPNRKTYCRFISDLNIVETYQQIQLTDLSSKGPTYWYWTFRQRRY